jgi:thiol-disulfide isomerase/thioredoxin
MRIEELSSFSFSSLYNLLIRVLISIAIRLIYTRRFAGTSYKLLQSKGDSENDKQNNDNRIKLPIIQIFDYDESLSGVENGIHSYLVAEFICGNDIASSIDRFKSFIFTKDKELKQNIDFNQNTEKSKYQYIQWPIENIYSDEALRDEVSMKDSSRRGPKVIKLYRDGCKKCMILEPVYYEMAKELINFHWFQVNADYIPLHVNALKERLSGAITAGSKISSLSGDEIKNKMTCDNCKDTPGFIACMECNGSGIVARLIEGSSSDLDNKIYVPCPTCTGYKKVRCTKCGGKCLKC